MPYRCRFDVNKYRAILFDLDGVIIDTMKFHYEAYRRAFAKHNIEVTQLDVYLSEGMPSMDVGRKLVKDKGVDIDEDTLRAIIADKRQIYRDLVSGNAQVYADVRDTLKMLHDNGIKLALVTGSNPISVMKVVKEAGLGNAFDAIVTGEDTRRGKPFPDPYLSAMKKLGVDRSNCVAVENAPLGIRSARAAGVCYIIAVTTTLPEKYLREADDIMPAFADLEDCLARRLAKA